MYTLINGSPVPLGEAFGYCYHPEVAGRSKDEMLGYSPVDKPNDWQNHPYLDTMEEAVEWLKVRGVAGRVMRYAHHEVSTGRGHTYRPWVTSGYVATVDGLTLFEKQAEYREACEWCDDYSRRIRAAASR